MPSLTSALLEQHRDTEPGRAATSATPPLRVAPDVVLLGPTVASFVVSLADARLGGAGARVRAIAWPERSLGARVDGEAKTLVESAARLGVPLLTAVGDACEPAFRETAAAPGRLAAVCGLDDEALGALGTLAVRVTALQAVAALSGGLLRTPARALVRWQCDGDLAPGVRGADVGLELARRWRTARPAAGTAGASPPSNAAGRNRGAAVRRSRGTRTRARRRRSRARAHAERRSHP
jgi:hypothetical protein